MDHDSNRLVPTKRRLDHTEDETEFSSNKKIKTGKNHYEEDNNFFSDLPPEVRDYILSFITSDAERRRIRLVCQLWFDHINYNEFRIGLLLASEVEEFSRCFGRYKKPIGLKFMKLDYLNNASRLVNTQLMTSKHFEQAISKLTQLTELDLRLKLLELPPDLVNLQSLTITCPLQGYNISKLTNLKRLKTSSPFAMTPTTLEALDFDSHDDNFNIGFDDDNTRLTELKLFVPPDLPEVPTNLRKLEIRSFNNHDWNYLQPIRATEKLTNLEELITTIPVVYPPKLTKLQINNVKKIDCTEQMTQLKYLQCNDINMLNYNLLQLESCVISTDHTNSTILQHLDPEKVTRLKIALKGDNYNAFAKFTKLVDLDLNLTSDPTTLAPAKLIFLEKLHMQYDILPEEWLAGLPNLVDLKLLRFSRNPAAVNLQEMSRLTSLKLFGYYTSLNAVHLTNLEQLEIYTNQSVSLVITGLSTLSNLTSLVFNNTAYYHDHRLLQNYEEVALLTKLRELCAITNTVDLATIATLQYLTSLEVRATSESISCLQKLSRLQRLFLEARKVDEDSILQALPFCCSLH